MTQTGNKMNFRLLVGVISHFLCSPLLASESNSSNVVTEATKGLKAISEDEATRTRLRDLGNNLDTERENNSLRIMTYKKNTEQGSNQANLVRQELKTSVQAQAMAQTVIFKKFEEGLSLDFDLANIFRFGGAASDRSDTASEENLKVRYRLSAGEIEPAHKSQLTAAVRNDEQDILSAPKAKVKWKVVPVKQSSGLNKISGPNKAKAPESSYPSTKFKGKITPSQNAVDTAKDEEASSKPAVKASLFQEENLYRFEYDTRPAEENDNIRQGVAVPLKDKIVLDREMDKGFKPVKTSLLNVIGNGNEDDSAQLNLHYLDSEDLYQSELDLNQGTYKMNFKATSAGGNEGKAALYEFGVSSDF